MMRSFRHIEHLTVVIPVSFCLVKLRFFQERGCVQVSFRHGRLCCYVGAWLDSLGWGAVEGGGTVIVLLFHLEKHLLLLLL